MADIDKRTKFDFIRYANCWEDASVLTGALRIKPGDRCASIASSGDNTLSLLTGAPSMVAAFDLNPAQLACLDIRMAAFRDLSHDELLAFIGVRGSRERIRTYRALRGMLSPESREFWDARTELVEQGIIHAGKFERYFRMFREKIIPLIHGTSMVERLLEEKSGPERVEFYHHKWNNLRWRILFRVFFSRRVMGKMGRDPEFFKYVDDDVASGILKRTEYAFTVLSTHDNPYLNFIFRGNFNEDALPYYLRKEHFSTIKNNIGKIALVRGDLSTCAERFPGAVFDAFNLSDIFEYMSITEFASELDLVASMSRRGARIAFWNMLADRLIPADNQFETDKDLSESLFLKDMAFFYKRFILAVKKGAGRKK